MTAFIRTKKIAAMLAAVMTVQAAVCSSHILQPISVGASEKTLSVTEFARDLQVFSLFDDPEEAYDTLVYHKEAGVLYADGQPVGTRRGDLTVGEEGLLICANAKGITKGMLTESPLLLPFEEHAVRWGYTVTEENGLFSIINKSNDYALGIAVQRVMYDDEYLASNYIRTEDDKYYEVSYLIASEYHGLATQKWLLNTDEDQKIIVEAGNDWYYVPVEEE